MQEPCDSQPVANRKYEARFFFAKNALRNLGAKMIGNADLIDRSDEALRALAHKMIMEEPSGEALKLVETHLVVVDVGLHKDCGGGGASDPQETLILFRPTKSSQEAAGVDPG